MATNVIIFERKIKSAGIFLSDIFFGEEVGDRKFKNNLPAAMLHKQMQSKDNVACGSMSNSS